MVKIIRKCVLALVVLMSLHNVALAALEKGTIEGVEWAGFSNDAKYGLVVGYILGANLDKVTAKQLFYGVNTFYSNPANANKTLEEAIYAAYKVYPNIASPTQITPTAPKFEMPTPEPIQSSPQRQSSESTSNISSPTGENLTIKNNAYGLGVHSDQYGRPVDLKPAYQGGGNTSGSYIQTPNAYGPGIHMDQYGAPVRAVPRY